MFVDIGAHQGIPQHVDQADDEEHGGCMTRLQSVDVGVEEQQIHADGLIDEVLGQIARAKADALEPTELVEALSLRVCYICCHCYFRFI